MKKCLLILAILFAPSAVFAATPAFNSAVPNPAGGLPVPAQATWCWSGTSWVGCGNGNGAPYTYAPLGFQTVGSLTSASLLSVPAGATIAYITVEGAPVRWRDDGTAPTATVGTLVGVGSQIIYSGSLAAIQFIQQSATATLDVSYYK